MMMLTLIMMMQVTKMPIPNDDDDDVDDHNCDVADVVEHDGVDEDDDNDDNYLLVEAAHIQIPSIHSSARLPLPPSRVQPLFLKQKYASSAPNRHSRYKCADKTPP